MSGTTANTRFDMRMIDLLTITKRTRKVIVPFPNDSFFLHLLLLRVWTFGQTWIVIQCIRPSCNWYTSSTNEKCDKASTEGNPVSNQWELVQQCRWERTYYKDMANSFLSYILSSSRVTCCHDSPQVHNVFDHYSENWTINHAREKRTGVTRGNVQRGLPDLEISKDWKLFLSRNENSPYLLKCYSEPFFSSAGTHLDENKHLHKFKIIITSLKPWGGQYQNNIASNTSDRPRSIVHYCMHSGYRRTKPSFPSPSIYTCTVHLLLHWTRWKICITQGHTMYGLLKPSRLVVIIPMYCTSGNTVSTFHGHGKGIAFRLMMQKSEYFQHLRAMGEHLEFSIQ